MLVMLLRVSLVQNDQRVRDYSSEVEWHMGSDWAVGLVGYWQ